MLRDLIIAEVREVRHKIERDCEDDPQKYFEHIEQEQEQYRNRLVKRKPKQAFNEQKLAL